MPVLDAVNLTLAEVAALCDGLALPLPAAFEDVDVLPAGEEDAELALMEAMQSLVGRGVVSVSGGSPEVAGWVAAAFQVLAAPGVLVRAVREWRGLVEIAFFYAVPELAVAQYVSEDGSSRIEVFAAAELADQLGVFGGLQKRPAVDVPPLRLTVRDMEDAAAHALAGRLDEAAERLRSAGAEDLSAEAFARALADRQRTIQVMALHRPSEGTIAGGGTGWLDCGVYGLWHMPPPEVDDDMDRETAHARVPLDITPATAMSLQQELRAILPESLFDGAPDDPSSSIP